MPSMDFCQSVTTTVSFLYHPANFELFIQTAFIPILVTTHSFSYCVVLIFVSNVSTSCDVYVKIYCFPLELVINKSIANILHLDIGHGSIRASSFMLSIFPQFSWSSVADSRRKSLRLLSSVLRARSLRLLIILFAGWGESRWHLNGPLHKESVNSARKFGTNCARLCRGHNWIRHRYLEGSKKAWKRAFEWIWGSVYL